MFAHAGIWNLRSVARSMWDRKGKAANVRVRRLALEKKQDAADPVVSSARTFQPHGPAALREDGIGRTMSNPPPDAHRMAKPEQDSDSGPVSCATSTTSGKILTEECANAAYVDQEMEADHRGILNRPRTPRRLLALP